MEKWLFRSIIFISILVSGSLYPIVFGGVVPTLLIVLISLVLFVLRHSYERSDLKKFGYVFGAIMALLVFHFIITGRNNPENEFFKFMFRVISALSVLLAYRVYKRNLLDDFIWVMNIIFLHAILNFLGGFLLGPFLETVKTEQIDCLTFKYIFFYFSEASSSGFSFLRNQGIFWEPGVLSVFLNLFLFITLFVRYNLTKSILIFLMIFTTFSTTGLVLALIQFIIRYKKSILQSFWALLAGIVFLLALIPLVIENVKDKISGEGQASFYWRSFDLLISFQIVRDNPLKGIGFGQEIYRKIQEQNDMFLDAEIAEGRGNTNSIVYIFMAFGIPLAIYILYMLYKQRLAFNKRGLFFFALVICLSTEPLITSVFFLIVLFSSLLLKPAVNQLNEG